MIFDSLKKYYVMPSGMREAYQKKACCYGVYKATEAELKIWSIIDGLRVEIDKNLTKEMHRLFRIEERYEKKGDKKMAREYRHSGMVLGINAKREVRDAFDTVLRGRKK